MYVQISADVQINVSGCVCVCVWVWVCVVCVCWCVCVSVCVGVCCDCLQMFTSVQMPRSMLRSVLTSVHRCSDQRTDAQIEQSLVISL
jgi:hypothetical protein